MGGDNGGWSTRSQCFLSERGKVGLKCNTFTKQSLASCNILGQCPWTWSPKLPYRFLRRSFPVELSTINTSIRSHPRLQLHFPVVWQLARTVPKWVQPTWLYRLGSPKWKMPSTWSHLLNILHQEKSEV